MRVTRLVLGLATSALVSGACGGKTVYVTVTAPASESAATAAASPTEELNKLFGTLTLQDYNGIDFEGQRFEGASCTGRGGYSDIQQGAQVVVKDGSESILAVDSLDRGQQDALIDGGSVYYCKFTFYVDAIPTTDFYSIEVSHRGALTYSAAEMEAQHWHVDFTLGS